MASFYMIFSDEDDEEFGGNNPMDVKPEDEDLEGKTNMTGMPRDGDDDKSTKSQTDSESKTDWQVLLAKLVTAYKVINNTNTVIGKLGFAILISDKSELKMILYKSKIDLLSTLIVKESNKIFQKGNFIQYLDEHQNFWSVLFENENDRDEAVRLLEERCTIQMDEMEKSINANDIVKVNESENNETENAKEDGGTSDKACETDPEEKQTKAMKASILTRMARMGKKIVLPNKTSNSEMSDSSDPESSPKRRPNSSPVLQVAKLNHGPIPHSTAQTVEFVKHSHGNNIISAASSDSSLNLMMMQNTEIRFNLSKLDSKLDKLCDKLETISGNSVSMSSNDRNNNDSVREEDIMRLEEKILSIKRENINLKSIIRNMEQERQKGKNEHSADEFNELKVQLKMVQQENRNISLELENKNEKILMLEGRLKDLLEEREIQLKNNEADLADLNSQLKVSQRHAQELQISLEKSQKQRDNASKESQTDGKSDASPSDVMIKEIMNNLYFKLCEKISNANDLKQSEILKIIGQTIKQETSECLKKHPHLS
ncbi:CLUMA_CG008061, isoform A [Clunio marinus]|uniref:CLUMA_CG008061, isoform A n=1 Tax=Clunio marinus TaxID=568069 RepID=A0A1J1I2M6_9DIPT|nr:CLUMA_CG008061, isoform A [Clunio marinus]